MEYAQLDAEIETIFRGLDITDRKSTLLATEAVLALYEEYLAGVSFGPHAGEMSKFAEQHAKRIRGILYNLKKRELSKKDNRYFFQLDKEDSSYLFQLYKNLFLTYAPKEKLPAFMGAMEKATRLYELNALLKKNAGKVSSEIALIICAKEVKPRIKTLFSNLKNVTHAAFSAAAFPLKIQHGPGYSRLGSLAPESYWFAGVLFCLFGIWLLYTAYKGKSDLAKEAHEKGIGAREYMGSQEQEMLNINVSNGAGVCAILFGLIIIAVYPP